VYYQSESKIRFKTTISTVNRLHICWNFKSFTLIQAVAVGHSGPVSLNFVVPRREVSLKHIP